MAPDDAHPQPELTTRRSSGLQAPSRRARAFGVLGAAVAIVAVLWFAWWLLVGRNHVTTDNAYVAADVADITPLVAGPVQRVLVVNTQTVAAGQPLVILNPADFQIALAQAEAKLGQAQRRVQGYYANEAALTGQVDARLAGVASADARIASAAADLDRARIELSRRQKLATSGAVSADELTLAENAFHTAQAAVVAARASKAQAVADVTAARGAREVNSALVAGPEAQNPDLAAARAAVRAARLDLARTVLVAPFTGVVAQKSVAVGERVQVGQTLMSVVPVARVYVDANFKEAQLRRVRIGQAVTLTSDLYGGGVMFHGRVVGLAGGTGSAFAVIPAQNATGNWIKVVQRLPVRIALDPAELQRRPLRVGLSMTADIDIAGR